MSLQLIFSFVYNFFIIFCIHLSRVYNFIPLTNLYCFLSFLLCFLYTTSIPIYLPQNFCYIFAPSYQYSYITCTYLSFVMVKIQPKIFRNFSYAFDITISHIWLMIQLLHLFLSWYRSHHWVITSNYRIFSGTRLRWNNLSTFTFDPSAFFNKFYAICYLPDVISISYLLQGNREDIMNFLLQG